MDKLKPKLFSVMKGYTKKQFLNDVLSGVIVAIVALPLSIALAIASGVNPEKGLYTAIVAGFIISFLGGSRVQIGGPTGAFMVIVFGIIMEYGYDGLVISTIMAGVILIILGLLRLGSVIKYIPYPITMGFTTGIAVKQAGISFVNGNDEDTALLTVMTALRQGSAADANRFMESLGFERLTKDE